MALGLYSLSFLSHQCFCNWFPIWQPMTNNFYSLVSQFKLPLLPTLGLLAVLLKQKVFSHSLLIPFIFARMLVYIFLGGFFCIFMSFKMWSTWVAEIVFKCCNIAEVLLTLCLAFPDFHSCHIVSLKSDLLKGHCTFATDFSLLHIISLIIFSGKELRLELVFQNCKIFSQGSSTN